MVEAAVAVLALSVCLAISGAISHVRRTGRWLNFRTLTLINFAVVYPLSGVVHLLTPEMGDGYFSLRAAQPDLILGLSILTLAATGALLIGLRFGTSKPPTTGSSQIPLVSRGEQVTLLCGAVLLVPIGLYASSQIRRYASLLDTSRIIGLPEGLARFSILSQWLVWAVCFLTLLLLSRVRSRLSTLLVLVAAVVAIFGVFAWNGGRSVALVFALPLVLLFLPRLGRASWVVGLVAAFTLVQYAIALSEDRGLTTGSEVSFGQWIDWEWGRWSMLGFAELLSASGGLYWGETLVASALRASQGFWRLVGLPEVGQMGSTMSEIAGVSLVGRQDMTYIVPGIGSELILNFGPVGLIVGCLLIGLLVARVDIRFSRAATATTKLAWAYIGSLLVLRLLVSDTGALFSYIVLGAAPLLIASWFALSSRRRSLRCGSTPDSVGDQASPNSSSIDRRPANRI